MNTERKLGSFARTLVTALYCLTLIVHPARAQAQEQPQFNIWTDCSPGHDFFGLPLPSHIDVSIRTQLIAPAEGLSVVVEDSISEGRRLLTNVVEGGTPYEGEDFHGYVLAFYQNREGHESIRLIPAREYRYFLYRGVFDGQVPRTAQVFASAYFITGNCIF